MVDYKVRMGDGSWYTLGSGSGAVAKIRRLDGTWAADDGTGLLAKVRKIDGTMATGVPFGAGLPTEPWVEVEQCGDDWCYVYRPILFFGANDGSPLAQWFFQSPIPQVYDGGGLCQSTPDIWHYGGDIGNLVNNGQTLLSGISAENGTIAWLRWQLGGPPAGYTGAFLRFSVALDAGSCVSPSTNWTKAVRLDLETGDSISTPRAAYGNVSGAANTISDGRGIVTKEAPISDFYLSTWLDATHSFIGQPVSALSTTTAAPYVNIKTHISQVALVFKYATNPVP